MSFFSEYLQILMKEKNYGPTALARDSGVNRTTLQKALSDERVLPYTALKELTKQLCLSVQERKRLISLYNILLEGEAKYQVRQEINHMLAELAHTDLRSDTYWEQAVVTPLETFTQEKTIFMGQANVRHLLQVVLLEAIGRDIAEQGAGEQGGAEQRGTEQRGTEQSVTGKSAGEQGGAEQRDTEQRAAGKSVGEQGGAEQNAGEPGTLRIELTTPCGASLVSECIDKVLCDNRSKAVIHQIILFNSSESDEAGCKNKIGCFQNVLTFCLRAGQRYQPYYFYENVPMVGNLDPFPYFAVCGERVVCFSAECDRAILLDGREQADMYHNYFSKILKNCHPLVEYIQEPAQIMTAFSNTSFNNICTMMTQPCLARFFTEQMIEANILPETPEYEKIVEFAKHYFGQVKDISRFSTFFSEKGIKDFLATGILIEHPYDFVRPLKLSERRQLLTALLKAIKEDSVCGRLIDESEMTFPDYMNLTFSEPAELSIYTTDKYPLQTGIYVIKIREPHLCSIFYDWFKNISNSESLFDKEATVKFLEGVL